MTVDGMIAELEQAYDTYRRDLEACEKKRKPTDGLFGLGKAVQDDPCHTRFDECVAEIAGRMCASGASAEDAASALRILLARPDAESWPLSAQWMLRAAERHALPLIPFLTPEAAGVLARTYAARYKPWDRLPVQKQVLRALKEKA